MYYEVNEKGEIMATCSVPTKTSLYTDEEIVSSYDGEKLLFKSETETAEYKAKESAYLADKKKEDIRRKRSREFATYLDRSPYFFEKLSEEQDAELREWYQAWLDAPATLVIPDRPLWLDTVSSQKKLKIFSTAIDF